MTILKKGITGFDKPKEINDHSIDEIENLIKILLNIKELDGKTYKQRFNEFISEECFFGKKRNDYQKVIINKSIQGVQQKMKV